MEVVFALITALGFGFDYYFIRKGLLTDPYPLIAAFLTLTVNFVFFLLLFSLYVPRGLMRFDYIFPFIVAGILAPGLARILSYRGLGKLGMGISTPIINSETLFSVLMAVIFLHERLNVEIGIGIVAVVVGLILLSYETGKGENSGKGKNVKLIYLLYPFSAAAFYGMSVFFRKYGLTYSHSPILGATVTSGTSWIILLLLLLFSREIKGLARIGRNGLAYFMMGGVMTCVAWFSIFSALNIGNISLVAPIANSYSLVTLFLSHFFLKKIEIITLRTVLATVLVVGGVTMLITGR